MTPRRAAPEADATRELYERYARQIYTYCLHQLGNREEAEDAVQSTFLNAFRGFKRGVDPEFESAWIYKIAQNVCLTRQRSSSRRRRVETASDLDAMQDYVPAHEIDADELINLPEALDAMPHQQRKALLLREWQGLSYKEIAEELDLTQAAVETLLFRARRSLAAGLGEEPAKKSALQRLRTGGDAGSALALLKSLLVTGGVKVATAVATVAATSVVVATPAARHAVEDVVTPGHDRAPAPAHQVARSPESGGAPASSRVTLPQRLAPAAGTVSSLVAPAHAHRATAPAAAPLRPHDSRAHAAPSPPAATAHPVVPAPTSVDTAAPPAAPVAPAAVAPAETPQAPAATDPAPAAPAATQPAAPEKAKGDDNKKADQPQGAPAPAAPAAKKDDPPGQKKNDAAATTSSQPSTSGSAPSSGDGGNRTTSNATPAAAPASAPPADPAPPKSDPKPSNSTGNGNANGNGNGNAKSNDDKGNGNGKKADAAPVLPVAPAPAPATTAVATTTTATVTTTAVTTTVAAPTPPPAAPQPAASTAQPVSTDNGNGKDKKGDNGNGNGKKK